MTSAQLKNHQALPQRVFPKEYYGSFDVRATQDGGRQYVLPHTLAYTALYVTTRVPWLAATLIASVVVFHFGKDNPWHPLDHEIETFLLRPERFSLAIAATFLPLQILVGSFVWAAAWFIDYRTTTTVTIRRDGLILGDTYFYPAVHIWHLTYVTYSYDEKTQQHIPSYLLKIQLGVHQITLAVELEEPAAKLFQGMFEADLRRYWHGHD